MNESVPGWLLAKLLLLVILLLVVLLLLIVLLLIVLLLSKLSLAHIWITKVSLSWRLIEIRKYLLTRTTHLFPPRDVGFD